MMEVKETFVHFGAILGEKIMSGCAAARWSPPASNKKNDLEMIRVPFRQKARRGNKGETTLYLVEGNERQVLDVLMVRKLNHLPVFSCLLSLCFVFNPSKHSQHLSARAFTFTLSQSFCKVPNRTLCSGPELHIVINSLLFVCVCVCWGGC